MFSRFDHFNSFAIDSGTCCCFKRLAQTRSLNSRLLDTLDRMRVNNQCCGKFRI